MFEIPWTEKYRPKKITDFHQNEDLKNTFNKIIISQNIQNLILSGPPGVGKTTIVHTLAHQILQENYKTHFFELNASESRGIDTVRNKIKLFAQKEIKSSVNINKKVIKIISLDEVDNMTTSAQQALRRTMENFAETTRFMMTCNISSKIIEPIQSRCCILRFTKIDDESLKNRLSEILEKENEKIHENLIEKIIERSEGDMRKAVGFLELAVKGTKNLTIENKFYEIFMEKSIKKRVKELLKLILEKKLKESFELVKHLKKDLGFSNMDIADCLWKNIEEEDIEIEEKCKLCEVAVKLFEDVDINGNQSIVRIYGCISEMILKIK